LNRAHSRHGLRALPATLWWSKGETDRLISPRSQTRLGNSRLDAPASRAQSTAARRDKELLDLSLKAELGAANAPPYEEQNVVACIEHLRPHVAEILLVDTESTDRTVELARPLVDRVLPHPHVPNFDSARNLAIFAGDSTSRGVQMAAVVRGRTGCGAWTWGAAGRRSSRRKIVWVFAIFHKSLCGRSLWPKWLRPWRDVVVYSRPGETLRSWGDFVRRRWDVGMQTGGEGSKHGFDPLPGVLGGRRPALIELIDLSLRSLAIRDSLPVSESASGPVAACAGLLGVALVERGSLTPTRRRPQSAIEVSVLLNIVPALSRSIRGKSLLGNRLRHRLTPLAVVPRPSKRSVFQSECGMASRLKRRRQSGRRAADRGVLDRGGIVAPYISTDFEP
jgi:hypothetical protein